MTLPASLAYLDESVATPSWQRIPQWASFYEQCGALAARGVTGRSRLVVALSVPDRYAVAPLLSVGVVLAVAKRELAGVTAKQRLAELKALPNDAVLRFVSPGGDSPRLGTFGGVIDTERGRRIKIISRSKGRPYVFYEPVGYAANIQMTSLTPDEIPRNGRARKAGTPSRRFWGRFLPGADLGAFTQGAKVECVILGGGPPLKREICDLRLRVSDDSKKPSEGCLNDLLRVGAYCSRTEANWTEVHSTSGARSLPERMKLKPRAVVFDGTRGFLRWRNHYPSSAWIVVLDRNDPQFAEGVDEVNAEMAMNSGPESVLCVETGLPSKMPIPPGVEVCAFFRTQAS